MPFDPDPKTLKDLLENKVAIAIDDSGNLGDAAIGKLVTMQINAAMRVKPAVLEEYFEYFDLDKNFLPGPIKPASVVTSILKNYPKPPPGDKMWLIGQNKWKLEFWPEQKADGSIEAPLVKRRRRSAEERRKGFSEWEQETVATIVWDPEHDPIEEGLGFAVTEGREDEYPYEEIFDAIDENYVDQLSHYTGSHVFSTIKKILVSVSALPKRQAGGVWVIPVDAFDLIARVEKLVDALIAPPTDERGNPLPDFEPDYKSEFIPISLADGNKSRLIIQGSVERAIIKDLSKVITRLNEMRKTGLPARPSELAEANHTRQQALAIQDHYKNVVSLKYGRLKRMLADYENLYEAAQLGEMAVEEPVSLSFDDDDDSDIITDE
jgi:hypothetical protein